MVVYADVLVVLNLIVDYFLVLLTAKILRSAISVWRALLSGSIGALSSLCIFIPQSFWLVEFTVRIIICALMTLAAFGFKGAKSFFRGMAVLFGVTFGYAGLMMAVWYIVRPSGMVINNSVVYFDISPTVLIVSSVISYFVISVIRRFLSRTTPDAGECEITLYAQDRESTVKAMIDTGNSIEDILGGKDVIIADKSVVDTLFKADEKGAQSRYRLLPCSTVSGGGMLEGYRCDKAEILLGGRKIRLNSPVIAISKTRLSTETPAIINPKVLE